MYRCAFKEDTSKNDDDVLATAATLCFLNVKLVESTFNTESFRASNRASQFWSRLTFQFDGDPRVRLQQYCPMGIFILIHFHALG